MKLFDKFKLRFPNANLSKFSEQDFMGRPNVMFHGSDGGLTAVFDDYTLQLKPSLYFSDEMKRELGLSSGFPLALTLNTAPKLITPAIPFSETPQSYQLGAKLVNQTIYVTPTDHFKISFRDIFDSDYLKLTHHKGSEAHRWLRAPNLRYWPQQLNFALWCATTGCGISSRLLFEEKLKGAPPSGVIDQTDSELSLPAQVRTVILSFQRTGNGWNFNASSRKDRW